MLQQEDYVIEVAERITSKPVIRSLAEITVFPPEVRAAIESAYRRGYCQGFYAGGGWEDEKLHAWRYSHHNGKFDPPPV